MSILVLVIVCVGFGFLDHGLHLRPYLVSSDTLYWLSSNSITNINKMNLHIHELYHLLPKCAYMKDDIYVYFSNSEAATCFSLNLAMYLNRETQRFGVDPIKGWILNLTYYMWHCPHTIFGYFFWPTRDISVGPLYTMNHSSSTFITLCTLTYISLLLHMHHMYTDNDNNCIFQLFYIY